MSHSFPRATGRRLLLAAAVVGASTFTASATSSADPGDVVYREDFSGDDLPDDFQVVEGDWQIVDGRLVGSSTGELSRVTFGPHLDHVQIEATMRFESRLNSSRWAGIITDTDPSGAVPWSHAAMRSASTAANGIEFAQRTAANTWNVTDAGSAPTDAGVGTEVDVKLVVHDNEGEWYFDDQLVLSTTRIARSDDGRLGFIVSGATVGFDDLVVTELADPNPDPDPDPVPAEFEEHFDSDELPAGWTPIVGSWSVHDGRLHLDEPTTRGRIVFGGHLANYRVEYTMRFEQVNNTGRWAGVITDIDPAGEAPWSHAVMRSASTATNGIEFAMRTAGGGWDVTDATAAPTDAATGRDVQVAVEVQGNRGRWFFDGELVLETTRIGRSANGVLGFIADGATVSIDDVVVTELDPPSLVRSTEAGPITIAHRGYSSIAPENTLEAVEAAIRSGAEMLEIDTHNAAGGATVVIHDSTVDRTTDGTGAVNALTTAQIDTLDAGSWFSSAYAASPVPLLDEVLDLMSGRGTTLLLEIKPGADTDDVRTQLDAVLARNMQNQVIVQSFDANVVRDARTLAPDIPRAWLTGALPEDALTIADDLGLVAINPHSSGALARPDLVAALNDAGVAVMPYTIDDAATWVRLTEIGVDGVITNKPGAHLGFRQGTVIEVPEPAATSVEVRVEQATGQADPTRELPVGFEVVFSEEIVGFDTGDIVVGGSAGAGELTITAITPGRRYLVEVSGATASGDVTVTVPAGVVATASALTNDASTSTDNTVAVDLTAECDVDYHVFGSWWSGYGVGIELTNTSDEVWDGWELGWTFAGDDDRVRAGWSGSFEQSDREVTVSNAPWNRVVRPDSTVYLGFNARHDGGVPEVPSVFTLEGLVCAG